MKKILLALLFVAVSFAQAPVVPAQPDAPAYSSAALNLFKTYDRASFKAAFGVDASKFNPDLQTKRWFDKSFGAGTYSVISPLGAVQSLSMSSTVAASVNLPGVINYPEREVAKTSAVVVTTLGDGSTVTAVLNEMQLSTFPEATAVRIATGASTVMEQTLGGNNQIDWRGEVRRSWTVVFKGQQHNVGLLLKEMNNQGVDAPGHWDTNGASPVWSSDPNFDVPSKVPGETAIPVRPLLANEVLSANPFGVVVFRKDKSSPAVGDVFTNADRLRLIEVRNLLKQHMATMTGKK